MLIDLYVAASADGASSLSDETLNQIQGRGLEALVLVGEAHLPNCQPVREGSELRIFSGTVLNVGNARLWALPPSPDTAIPADLGDNPGEAVSELANSGWAVLLCNPYARELPGGELRDRAMEISDIHGYLSFTAAAPFGENLLAQELAMAQRKAAGAGTGMPADHAELGRYFTLAIPEIASQEDLVAAIRDGQVLPVESAGDGFAPIEAAMRPRREKRPDGRGERGGRDRNRGGRDRNRGGRGNDNRRRPDHNDSRSESPSGD